MDWERAQLLDEGKEEGGANSCDVAPLTEGPRMEFGAYSDQGGRRRNEDYCTITDSISCVSDGIGGAEHGNVMSRLACATMCEEWDGLLEYEERPQERMRLALVRTDAFLTSVAMRLGGGPGATIVAVAQAGDDLVFGSVGDSRAFVLGKRGFESVFQDSGRESDTTNALSAALGYGMLEKDKGAANVASLCGKDGISTLLCTDGVWDSLTAREIEGALLSSAHPWFVARALVDSAVKAGGAQGDNATALVGMPVGGLPLTDGTPLCPPAASCNGALS